MAASTEPRSGLFYGWALGEQGWNTGMDANLLRLGRFGFHLSVKSRQVSAPPASPAASDTYIVGPSATGAWGGNDGKLTLWDGAAWVFVTPRKGYSAWIEDQGLRMVFGDSGWQAEVTSYTDEQVRDVIAAALTAGAGITVTADDAANTITIAIDTTAESERIRDVIGAALVAGAGISITVDDAGESITIANTGGGGGGGTTYDDEQARDAIAAALVAGTGITITVDDAANTITISGVAAYTDEQARDAIGAALTTGPNLSVTVDDPGNTIKIETAFDKAEVYINTAANSTTAGTQKVPFDAVNFDTNSIWDATNKRFIPKKAGYYQVNVRVRLASANNLVAMVGKNGTAIRALGPDSGTSSFASGGSDLVYCNGTTDYIEAFIYTTVARAYTNTLFDSHMSIIGPF